MKYTKKHVDRSLFLGGKGYTTYYKDGVEIAHKTDGEPIRWRNRDTHPIFITRSQAYRYWRKYFTGRRCFDLPEPLASAVIYSDIDGVWFDGREWRPHYC